MALINWSDTFSLNIEEVDNQHKKLIDIINELSDSIKVNKGVETINHVLDQLIEYTLYHFKTEEDYMDKFSYPYANDHKFEHENLTIQVITLSKKVKEGSYAITFEVLQFLKNWLTDHMLNSDKRFGNFLKTKGL
jgi:hemerythrin